MTDAKELAMIHAPPMSKSEAIGHMTVAVLATVIGVGIVTGVTVLFQSRGEPLGQLVAAERACGAHEYVSDLQKCMSAWLAAQQETQVAHR
ncbi:MAG: hypothetical protein IT516_03085 [Burkholderiales bacterium]|nr:hypothetical protein [Burkholderiales bacterium]